MFPTSRVRRLVCCCAGALVCSAAACDENGEKTPGNDAVAGASSVEAGAAGELNTAAAGVAGAHATEGPVGGSSAQDDSSYAGNNSAVGECRSGQTRCHGQLGFQSCTPDGVWGATQSCGGYSVNGTSSYCALFEQGDGPPWAACVDPACWWWKQSGLDPTEEVGGICAGNSQVRVCRGGILGRPTACTGTCQRVGEIDGRELGYCASSCNEGDRECLGGSLYRECLAGEWSTVARVCADGALCQPLAQSERPDIKCGGACEAGTSRCSADGASLEVCEDGAWAAKPACMLGRCVQAAAQAQCQTECSPGEHACAFDGATSELVCGETGLWSEPSQCEAGASCRVGRAGALGCLACVGPQVEGGNAWGVGDSRCGEDGIERCAADVGFGAAEPCAAEQSCVELARGAASLAYCE